MTQRESLPGTATGEAPKTDQPDQVDANSTAPQRHNSRGAQLLDQLRRRHEAARRLPPLPHNRRRDPLTPRERADGWPR
jgi:hypothetical protein